MGRFAENCCAQMMCGIYRTTEKDGIKAAGMLQSVSAAGVENLEGPRTVRPIAASMRQDYMPWAIVSAFFCPHFCR